MTRRLVIGGCVYRSQVHVGHAASVAQFARLCDKNFAGARVDAIAYQHASNITQGRYFWLRNQLQAEKLDLAITVDSDTAFNAGHLVNSLRAMGRDVAIGIAPVVRRIGESHRLNIYKSLGNPYKPSECGGELDTLWAGGFGLAVLNLAWFRKHWPAPYPEVFGDDPTDSINQSEDIQMCRSVALRGGSIVALWVGTTHFDVSGYGVIGTSVSYENGMMVPV